MMEPGTYVFNISSTPGGRWNPTPGKLFESGKTYIILLTDAADPQIIDPDGPGPGIILPEVDPPPLSGPIARFSVVNRATTFTITKVQFKKGSDPTIREFVGDTSIASGAQKLFGVKPEAYNIIITKSTTGTLTATLSLADGDLKYIIVDDVNDPPIIIDPVVPPVVDTTPPGDPVWRNYTNKTSTTVQLNWTNPGDADLLFVEVTITARSPGSALKGTLTNNIAVMKPGNSLIVGGLQPDATYAFLIRAADDKNPTNYTGWKGTAITSPVNAQQVIKMDPAIPTVPPSGPPAMVTVLTGTANFWASTGRDVASYIWSTYNAPTLLQVFHRVQLTQGFKMSKYETTQGEWKALMGSYPASSFYSGPGRDVHPVTNISWLEAVAYCNARTTAENLAGANPQMTLAYNISGGTVTWNKSATGYRLPTEWEWEYAAMGGTGPDATNAAGSGAAADVYATLVAAKKWFGKYGDHIGTTSGASIVRENYNGNSWFKIPGDNAEYRGPNYGTTWIVGSGAGNVGGYGYGLYDMMGNVMEFCWDFGTTTPYHGHPSSGGDYNVLDVNPSNDTDTEGYTWRSIRGGCYSTVEIQCSVGQRSYASQTAKDNMLGFRVFGNQFNLGPGAIPPPPPPAC
jgi:formylglycine-generating enzyme required for sulfatase activity